jgi:CHAD domain-containing protein
MTTAYRAAIGRRLAIRRKSHRPPAGRWKSSGHEPILARGLRTTVAATVLVGVTVGIAALARTERARRATHKGRSRRARHFGLLADEPPQEGLRRMALGQVDLALEMLDGESQAAPEVAVHEVRKAIKRLRALLALLERALGRKEAARERALLRETANRLAGARDADVMIATLEGLVQRHPRRLARRGVRELRSRLERQRLEARQSAFDGAVLATTSATAGPRDGLSANGALGGLGERAVIEADLRALRTRIAAWSLPPGGTGRALDEGLREIYRAGRTGCRRAGKRKPDPLAFHRWRKHVKELRYAAEALDLRETPKARAGGSARIAKLARRADELGELLGEEHDLALLAELVRTNRPLRARKRSRKALLGAIARRRTRLRERALREGARLYALPPGPFTRRISRARARAGARTRARAPRGGNA